VSKGASLEIIQINLEIKTGGREIIKILEIYYINFKWIKMILNVISVIVIIIFIEIAIDIAIVIDFVIDIDFLQLKKVSL
jgi:hypothetical protein